VIDIQRKLNYIDPVPCLSLISLTWAGLSRIPSIKVALNRPVLF